ncbi:MAG: hypothetical protein AB1805_01485 [Nitrospirota bacterium]
MRVRSAAAALIVLFLVLCAPRSSPLAEVQANHARIGGAALPSEYGEVIYRYNERSPHQLYVIGIKHRSTANRKNGLLTARAQAETFKIGEWLIRNEGVELLFPEGFFERSTLPDAGDAGAPSPLEGQATAREPLDLSMLEARLGDDSVFVNAEMLLGEHYRIRKKQAEDRELYDAASDSLSRLEQSDKRSYDYLALLSRLEYLQQRRTAAMLQAIPGAIDDAFTKGEIRNRKALLTIGMNHLLELITYVKENKIAIYCPPFVPGSDKDYIADVALCNGDFGLTVIIPRVLADNREVLTMTRLHTLVPSRAEEQSSPPRP